MANYIEDHITELCHTIKDQVTPSIPSLCHETNSFRML
jgi:hypothetical protein